MDKLNPDWKKKWWGLGTTLVFKALGIVVVVNPYDIERLDDGMWLNDELINICLLYLVSKVPNRTETISFRTTLFWLRLEDKTLTGGGKLSYP